MRRSALAIALSLALPIATASAESFEGNWACRAGDLKTGILTIYGESYGFAAATFGDTASGTGSVTGYADGVAFVDGPLVANLGLQAGRIVPHDTLGVAMQLETASEITMLCTAR